MLFTESLKNTLLCYTFAKIFLWFYDMIFMMHFVEKVFQRLKTFLFIPICTISPLIVIAWPGTIASGVDRVSRVLFFRPRWILVSVSWCEIPLFYRNARKPWNKQAGPRPSRSPKVQLGVLGWTDLVALEDIKDKTELGCLGSHLFGGEGRHVLVVLRWFMKVRFNLTHYKLMNALQLLRVSLRS